MCVHTEVPIREKTSEAEEPLMRIMNEKMLCRSRRDHQPEIDGKQNLKCRCTNRHFGDRVASMRDDPRRKMKPVVAKTAHRLFLPLITEIVALQQLNHCEGKNTDREVHIVGGKLSAGHVIEPVMMFEFSDHLLEFTTGVVEVDDRLWVLFFLWDVGGNGPVLVRTVEEIMLVCCQGGFCNQAE